MKSQEKSYMGVLATKTSMRKQEKIACEKIVMSMKNVAEKDALHQKSV